MNHGDRVHAHAAGAASAILVVVLACVLAAGGYYVFRHKMDAFRFHYFKVRVLKNAEQPV